MAHRAALNGLDLREAGVAVVGAGVAGLAAAARLRRHGVPVTLLEAAQRIGGRAWTTYPCSLGGLPFDEGAAWLHAAEHNPLMAYVRPGRDRLVNSDAIRHERVFVGTRLANDAELAEYDAAWAALDSIGADGPDGTVADAIPRGPWAATLALWEGAIIAAADVDALGREDWRRNSLHGANLLVSGGLGAFVARRLSTPAQLCTHVTGVDWSGTGVRVETSRGTVVAGACIITASTGVLASGRIRFTPGLPDAVLQAVQGLPMGLATKVALRASGPDRLDLPAMCSAVQQVGDAPGMVFNAWRGGRDVLAGTVGGRLAWSVAGRPREAEALVRDGLRRIFGARAGRALSPGAHVTTWGEDPFTLGAYAYAGPGAWGLRAQLAGAFPGERLLFAGEACRSDGLAGTVGGAYLSGQDAADRLLATAT